MNWWNQLLLKFGWRPVPLSKLPKADLTTCLRNLALRGFDPRHIVDVGANRGKWSREASRVFPLCDFTLIEPQREMESRLRQFCGSHENRRYLLAGAGSAMGELPFTVYPNTVASTFMRSADVAAQLGLERRMVPVITVDHVAHAIIRAVPDIIKVDAEGFEQEVVKGSQSLLGKTEVIFLEAHFLGDAAHQTEFANLVAFMAERDYVPYDFTWFGRRGFDHALELCEIAFVRRHGFLRSLHPDVQRHYVPAELNSARELRRSA